MDQFATVNCGAISLNAASCHSASFSNVIGRSMRSERIRCSAVADELPDSIRMRPENLFNRFSFREPPARPVQPDNWAAVVRALCDRSARAVV